MASHRSHSRFQRSLDEFLINPTTVRMDDRYGYDSTSKMPDNLIPVTPPYEIFSLKPGQKTPEPTATINGLTDEPFFWHGYTSEEELASPVDADGSSFGSFGSDTASIASSGEASYHAETCNAQQLCTRAQAVQVLSAGKAKVVSMPKVVDVGSPTLSTRPTTSSSSRSPKFALDRMYIDGSGQTSVCSTRSSPRSSDDQWPTLPSTIDSPTQMGSIYRIRQRPSPLQLVPRSESPHELNSVPKTFHPARTINFLDYDPYPSSARSPSPTPSKRSTVSRLSSFSLKDFGIKGFGRSLKRYSASDKRRSDEAKNAPTDPYGTSTKHYPAALDLPSSTRIPRKPLPKMVPRGANERAPPLILPSCPIDYADEEEEPTLLTPWPLRDDSMAVPSVQSPTMNVQHRPNERARIRRKNVPAYVASARV